MPLHEIEEYLDWLDATRGPITDAREDDPTPTTSKGGRNCKSYCRNRLRHGTLLLAIKILIPPIVLSGWLTGVCCSARIRLVSFECVIVCQLRQLGREEKHSHLDTGGGPTARRPASSRGCLQKDDVETEGICADGLLAKRCLAGEVAAWEQLYAQCHEPLLVSIRIMLGSQSADANLVDEIAARVWYALVANDGELLSRYKPSRALG